MSDDGLYSVAGLIEDPPGSGLYAFIERTPAPLRTGLAADIAAELPGLRSEAESRMTATCTVRRATGETTQDPVTLEDVPVYAVIHADLKCRVKAGGTQANAVQIPGQTIVLAGLEWHVPINTVGVRTNDLVTIDSVDSETGDPDLVGQVLRVTGPFFSSSATARRYRVEVS